MSAGLRPLRHNEIAPRPFRRDGFLARPDLPRHEGPARMSLLDEGRVGGAVKELDDARSRGGRLHDASELRVDLSRALIDQPSIDEVRPEAAGREKAGFLHQLTPQ